MLTLKAPAKINWFLHVFGRRDDGFHEIRSLIQKITLYDVLEFSGSQEILVRTDSDIPLDQNLVFRAAVLLKKSCNIDAGAEIRLHKNIPMGAGLGGGSSDAAAALTGLNRLWNAGLSEAEISDMAAQLGSDVPFFLRGPVSLVSGRGEMLSAQKALKKHTILIVKPSFDVSTAWAYGELSRMRSAQTGNMGKTGSGGYRQLDRMLTKKGEKVNNIEHFFRSIENTESGELAKTALNDLESVTIEKFPVIAEIKDMLLKEGAFFSLMSGSGSAVFGVFESKDRAEQASSAFGEFWTAVVQTVTD